MFIRSDPTRLERDGSGGNIPLPDYMVLVTSGASTNWATLPGSENVTSTNLPLHKSHPSVFFRMVYTNAP